MTGSNGVRLFPLDRRLSSRLFCSTDKVPGFLSLAGATQSCKFASRRSFPLEVSSFWSPVVIHYWTLETKNPDFQLLPILLRMIPGTGAGPLTHTF